MKAEDIRRRLAELALDTNEYRINAGGAMVRHGLREETHGRHTAVRPRAGRGDL